MSWARLAPRSRFIRTPSIPVASLPPDTTPVASSPLVVTPDTSSSLITSSPSIHATSNNIWGPALWMILHNACEKIGSHQVKKLPQEETRIWFGLLKSLRYSLPCPQCKKHYSVYFGTTPITRVDKEFIQNWLYTLHNQINERNQKPAFPKEELVVYDTIINVSEQIAIVHEQMLKAVRQGWSSANDIQHTIRYLMEMKCFYNLI